MSFLSWFSADEDGNVVAKTDVHEDGSVHRYEYTVPDEIEEGHGHAIWNEFESFIADDNPNWERDKDEEESQNKRWHGEGYTFTLEELKQLREELNNSIIHTTSELLLKLK